MLENIACLCLMLANDLENSIFFPPATLESLQTIQINTIFKLPPKAASHYLMFHFKKKIVCFYSHTFVILTLLLEAGSILFIPVTGFSYDSLSEADITVPWSNQT